jgi:SAM-dependent methyltransferase
VVDRSADGPTKAGTAAARWRALVRACEADATRRERRFPLERRYTGERAAAFARASDVADPRDPFLRRVRRRLTPKSTVIDVGAGAGRYALALAPEVEIVTAVDPSGDLLEFLDAEARRRGIANVRTVHARWEDTNDERADVVVCYGVLGAIVDPTPFLEKLDRAARRSVFLGLHSGVDVLRDPLWRHFHGRPHPPAPSFLDAVAILVELGIEPQTEVLEYPVPIYADQAGAVDAYRELLELPSAPDVDAELGKVLDQWLIRRRDGRLRVPGTTFTYAAVSWSPS